MLNIVPAFFFLIAAVAWSMQTVIENEDEIAAHYPVAAVDYLEKAGLAQQRGYNSYNWGGYLIWRRIPVFVDGRADVYGDAFLHEYRRTFDPQPGWRVPLDSYEISYVLMERASPAGVLLSATGKWQQVYADDVAELFVRSSQ